MDVDSSSSDEIEEGNIPGNQQVNLPGVPNLTVEKTNALTPSLLAMAQKRKRTIDTEFGTIVVDSDGIEVHSHDNKASIALPGSNYRDPSARKIEFPKRDCILKESSHLGGSRMILFNPTKTASRLLESVTERKVREERGVWKSDGELLSVACSSLVNVATLLYMPHLSLQTGGGAFLLMYALCLLLVGAPLLLLEAVLGQFSAHGLAKLMPEMAPVLKGYSYALLISLVVITVTCMPAVSRTTLYSVEATRSPAAWTTCNGRHNSPLCYTHALDHDCQEHGEALYVGSTCFSHKEICESSDGPNARWNFSSACVVHSNQSFTLNRTRLNELRTVAGEEFFRKTPNAIFPWLKPAHTAVAMSLLFCWVVVAFISQAGAAGVRYTLPFVIGGPLLIVTALTIALIHSHRATRGAWSLLALDTHSLADSRGWLNAAKYTLCSQWNGLGVNSFIYSRNMLTHDCKRSTLTLVMLKLAICTLCVVCYALLVGTQASAAGEKAKLLTMVYEEHHALVQLTSALATVSGSQAWSVLMLVAIMLVGFGSVQILLLTIEASLRELKLVRDLSTRAVVFLLCAVFFVVNLVSTVPSSYFTCMSVHQHVSVYLSILLAFSLVVAVNATLGVEQLLKDMRDLMAVPMRWSWHYWHVSWCIVCPLVLLILFIGTIAEQAMLPLKKLHGELPTWTLTLSGLLTAGPLALLLGYVYVEHRRSERFESDLEVCAPTMRWRPGLLHGKTHFIEEQDIAESSHALMMSKSSLMTYVYSPMTGWSKEEMANKGAE